MEVEGVLWAGEREGGGSDLGGEWARQWLHTQPPNPLPQPGSPTQGVPDPRSPRGVAGAQGRGTVSPPRGDLQPTPKRHCMAQGPRGLAAPVQLGTGLPTAHERRGGF